MRQLAAYSLVLCACGGPAARSLVSATEEQDGGTIASADGGQSAPDAGTPASLPSGPSLAGCPMFPADNPWNRDISAEPVDPHSADYLAYMGAGSLRLHPDFGGPYGQPFVVVPGAQPRVPMSFLYSSQSDPGPYPFPNDLPIQANEDRHATVLVRDECKIYETYNTFASGSGYHADSGAVFDLDSGAPRPDGWTSATASCRGSCGTTKRWSRARSGTRSPSSRARPRTRTSLRQRTPRGPPTRSSLRRWACACACGRTSTSRAFRARRWWSCGPCRDTACSSPTARMHSSGRWTARRIRGGRSRTWIS